MIIWLYWRQTNINYQSTPQDKTKNYIKNRLNLLENISLESITIYKWKQKLKLHLKSQDEDVPWLKDEDTFQFLS